MVNNSTQLARAIATAVLEVGATDVVVCPGSRNAALSWQFAQLAEQQRINLHTRIDEREAGFLALGLAKASGRPVPVVVTSGTAVANLLPAVVEAHHSGVPLVVLSADRPAQVRGYSAPQTTLQPGMFANFVKTEVDTIEPTNDILAALKYALINPQGPVQINAQFDMPLLPEDPTEVIGEVRKIEVENIHYDGLSLELPAHGVLIVGDVKPTVEVVELAKLAVAAGYPIIIEPTSQLHNSPNALSHGALLLQTGKTPKPDVVITTGLVGLSRSVLNLLKTTQRHIAIQLPSAGSEVPNPVLTAKEVLSQVPTVHTEVDPTWLTLWQELDQAAAKVVQENLSSETLSGPSAAVALWNEIADDAKLFISPSWPVRHIEMYAPNRSGLVTYGNRGVNGIDGLISTAVGVASSTGSNSRTYLLMGDIAYLHGMAGLNISADNSQPNLTVVVLDNDGSGIFSQLEQGQPTYAKHFEKVFGTPHGRDLWVIAESLGIPAQRVTTKSELVSAINSTNKIPGISVIICTTGQRSDEQELIELIKQKVTAAV